MNDLLQQQRDLPDSIVAARHWHAIGDGEQIQCDLCPRFCHLKSGQRGFCFVRANLDGAMVLTTWGRSSGFCVDPIEKKPLNHFYPGTSVLSFGTAGCNLGCKFCQNWDISKSRATDTLAATARPETIARTAAELGCQSVAYTYNDPVIFHEYAIDVANACHALGIKNVAVTAGYVTAEPRAEFYAVMDAANVDLKAFNDEFYHTLTGSHLQPVLDTLEYIVHNTSVWLEITTLLIPGKNDSEAEIDAMTRWIVHHLGPHVPIHFTAFHPDWKMRDLPATPAATLMRARQIALANGLHYPYTGNIVDTIGNATWCHHCAKRIIERRGYTLGEWQLDALGHCRHCGCPAAGHFNPHPGTWGNRRLPLQLRPA
jgi:pyruvate formate lyase activating enzyme